MGSLFKKSEDAYCKEGMQYLMRGQFTYAQQAFDKGIKAFPESFSLHANRANIGIQTGDFAASITDLSKALQLMPRDSQSGWALLVNRGSCYLRTEQEERALKDLDQALEEAPADADATIVAKGHFYRALTLMDKDPAKALVDAQKACQFDPQDQRYRKLTQDLAVATLSPEAQDLGQKGAELLQSGQLEQALECFNKLVELAPGSAKGWQLKGATLHQLGRYLEELEALNRSLEIDGNEVALFNRAVCHLALENLPSAREDLTRFLQVGTHGPTVQKAQFMLQSLS